MNVNITRILLIEDNAGDVRLLREMLKEDGDKHYDLACTDRLSTGLKYLSEQHPDIILMDMGLPDSQGLKTLSAVLAVAKVIPVIVLTGLNDESVGAQAVRQGAQDYLIKGSLDSRAIARVIDYAIERKHAEIALKVSEERFRRLAENIPDIIYRFNLLPQRGYEYVSPASTLVTGYTPEEYYADPELGAKLIHPEDKGLTQSMANKPEPYKGVPLTVRYVRKDGRIISVEKRQTPIYDEEGKLIALEIIDRDVTEDVRMEEALSMSEANFRNSMDHSPIGGRIVSLEGETIYANRKFLEMYGYENLAEFRSKSVQQRYTPESYQEYIVRKERRQRSEHLLENYEISIVRKDGSIRHLEVFRKKVLWGGEQQFQTLYNDVTERKQAEDQRKLSLAILAMLNQQKEQKELIKDLLLLLKEFSGCEAVGIRLLEGGDYPYYESNGFPEVHLSTENYLCARDQMGELIFDPHGNPVLECMCGNIIRGRFDPKKTFFTTGGSFWTNSTTDLLASTTEEDRQARTRNRCNGEGYESVALIPLKTDHETIGLLQLNDRHINRFTAELIHFYEDIAQSIGIALIQKRAEEAIRVSEENFRSSLDNSLIGIRISDIDNNSLYVNQAFLDTFGYNNIDEVRAKPPQEYYTRECYAEYLNMRAALKRGEKMQDGVDIDIVREDGTIRNLQAFFKVILWDGKQQFQTLYNNITERNRAEEMVRQMEVMKQVDLLRSNLLANVSHELRTPLSVIKGFTSTMRRKDVKWSAKQREDFLQIMDEETDRLTRLISDILDMSRLDAGALKLKQGKYLVSEIVGSVKGRLEVLTAHHRLEINVPEKLPAIFVDEMRIGQVISNLVENAVKFSLANSVITIAARLKNNNIVISVTDHGEGMPKEVMEKLFNRFYQADNVVTGQRSGTGLGLSICRGIIENHGGKIWVESKVQEGSKFSFSLPIVGETND